MNRKERRIAEAQSKPIPDDLLPKAMALHQSGNLDEAQALYKTILKAHPAHAGVLNLLGTLHLQKGNSEEAVSLLEHAIAINPNYVDAYYLRGLALYNTKRYAESLASYDHVIILKPDHADAYFNRGNVLNDLERYEEALASYDKAIAINPGYAEAYTHRGNILSTLKRYDEALASYYKSIALNPNFAETHNSRGNALNELKRYQEAVASYNEAIDLRPDYARAYFNRGVVQHNAGLHHEARASYDKVIAMNPNYAQAYYQKGILLHRLQRHEDALLNHDKALAIDPNYADAHLDKSTIKLLLGEYEEGWKLYEWRWKSTVLLGKTPSFLKPLWLGQESLGRKTILLHTEQGNGDILQFCRYAPMLEALGAKVLLDTLPSMMGLMSTLKGSIHVVQQGSPLPEFDFHCPLMSLPLAFGTTLETIPSEPYLFAQPEYAEKWKTILNKKLAAQSLRIGLCWAGGQRPDRADCVMIDARRSIHFNTLKPLLDAENTSFVSLQLGTPKEQLDDIRVVDIFADLKDWSDTAAVISLLDLVISVDTSVCHLAGAMGKKTWLLNRYDTCWRWLLDRDDSPWYPSLTQFRQTKPMDWDDVIARVKAELSSIKP